MAGKHGNQPISAQSHSTSRAWSSREGRQPCLGSAPRAFKAWGEPSRRGRICHGVYWFASALSAHTSQAFTAAPTEHISWVAGSPLTVWPSGLRRWLQAPVRKGVGSNPTAVTCILKVATARVSARMMGAPGDAAPCRHLVALPHPVRQFGSGERCSLLLHPAAGQHQNPDVCVASGCAGGHRAPAHMARLLGRPRRSPGYSLHIHPARIELATFSVLG